MNRFTELSIDDFTVNPFNLIGKEWMLISAARPDGEVNTMTASWGGLGFIWNKPVAYIFIRPQRYTKEFIDASSTLSLSFLPKEYRKELGYLGATSGRDEAKIEKSGLKVAFDGETPYFEESTTVMLGHKLYAQDFDPAGFIDKGCDTSWYPEKDYHTVYVVEIDRILTAE